jgi:AraC family transcriptional regulator, regulatory protein of adaptative response / methylated-DNA-[protein]-cysteine methyltransferase
MNDYDRIAQVIRYLDARQAEQPDLARLAGLLGLSSSHFHRLFTEWAGITPKDFLQCLTLTHAKRQLLDGASVLDAALSAGVSGPGRLHDLCITLEAASPGEIKSGGAGWRILFGFGPTPFGTALLAQGPRGICHLAFCDEAGSLSAEAELRDSWPAAAFIRDDPTAQASLGRIFRPASQSPSTRPGMRAYIRGSSFQTRVWKALLLVPPGALVTYSRLAEALEMPTAARAVGSAVAANPLAYLIPCHRVIRQTGVIGDYRWGSIRKRAMLAWETASAAASGRTRDAALSLPAPS